MVTDIQYRVSPQSRSFVEIYGQLKSENVVLKSAMSNWENLHLHCSIQCGSCIVPYCPRRPATRGFDVADLLHQECRGMLSCKISEDVRRYNKVEIPSPLGKNAPHFLHLDVGGVSICIEGKFLRSLLNKVKYSSFWLKCEYCQQKLE